MTQKERIKTQVLIIGAGPAGLTAGLYASRANLKTMILEQGAPGGELLNTADVENYPGYPSISGPDLAMKFYESAMQFDIEMVYGIVERVELVEDKRLVYTQDMVYEADVLIIATGAHHRKLQVPGESELTGKGVSYCAVCDGFFFKNREIVVVGGGDSAVEEGTYLTQFADKVTLIHRRDKLRAQEILQQRAFGNDKMDFIWDTVVEEITGDEGVEGLKLRNVKTNEVTTLDAQGVFVYIGLLPNSDLVADLNITDEAGWIVTNELMETAVPGIYAIGDVRQKHLRQISTAVGDGAIAGQRSYEYIQML